MKHSDGYFKGPRQRDIYYQSWHPDKDTRAVLLIVHGMGEHCGRYMNLVDYFVPKGIAVYGLDHIGHGRSAGRREFIHTFADFTGPLGQFHAMVREDQPGKPLFLLGHSMGGAIALDYLLTCQEGFHGAVLSSPALKPCGKVSPLTIAAGNILSRIWPMAGVLALDPNAVSRDPLVVKAYMDDPLTFKKKTPARLASRLLAAMTRIKENASMIGLPLLIVQGGGDTIVDPSGAQMIYENAGSADKTLKIYEGLFHETFNEPEKEQVLNDVNTWLEKHI